MKELEHSNEAPATRALKSLLKKPGQGKQRTHKNRVVINEKLNEFFAADYIILIKEECCADYEEECDCCCQETEMIRVGNCKECRAELSRQLASSGGGGGIDPHYGIDRNGGEIDDDDDDVHRARISEESQCEDEGEEEEEEYEEEVDDYEDESSEEPEQRDNTGDNKTPVKTTGQQQQETLSPPEGYKDVCDEDKNEPSSNEQICLSNVCGECNYYQRNASGESALVMSFSLPFCLYPRFTLALVFILDAGI
uniref:Uncharacterized protein n=1 Tax=Bracon brevicornis TaxID=1563983 RepID=A0A6V7I1K0_9HYME